MTAIPKDDVPRMTDAGTPQTIKEVYVEQRLQTTVS